MRRLPSRRRGQRRDERNRRGGGRDADDVPDEPAAGGHRRRGHDACGQNERARGQCEQRAEASQQRPRLRLARACELDRPVRKLGHEEETAGNQWGCGVENVCVADDEHPGIARRDEHEGGRNEARASENERDGQHDGAGKREEAERRLLERGRRCQGKRSEEGRAACS